MLKIIMVNGDAYTGRIIYNSILPSYAPLLHCNDDFIVLLQDTSGKQILLNRGLIVSINDTTQS